MTRSQKRVYWALVLLWLTFVAIFWFWWLKPAHFSSPSRFLQNSAMLAWPLLLTGYYFYFVNRMQHPDPNLTIPGQWRIAMVVTKAPSEPEYLVKHTLEAMLLQSPAHDTWVADEHPTPHMLEWYREHNVFVSCRKDDPTYHRRAWPRRLKCKEGNLAYFYDHFGYQNYDFVVQLDADHTPDPGYLTHMLRPFHDSRVGYVSAPSICDINASNSWIARARLYAESSLHGTLQAGYTNGWSPLCIGSHYAVRTEALKQIGGLGPELAEDHSTSFLLNAAGWRGIHSIDAIAHGEGPLTFADAMTQEYQWARSLVVILFSLTPRHLTRLPLKLKLQFLFSQLWYPLFGIFMLTAYLMPLEALVSGRPWAGVNYLEFAFFSALPTLVSLAIMAWIRRQGWLRPANVPLLSWENFLFQFARWPWVLWATVTAIASLVLRIDFNFRVTPKGTVATAPVPLSTLSPYIVLGTLTLAVVLMGAHSPNVAGYYYFALVSGASYVLLVCASVYKHFAENEAPSN